MLEAAFLLPQSPDPSPRLIPQAIHFVNEVWKQLFVYIKEAIESSVDTGLAYVSVTEAVQAALLASSEWPNTPNDWDKTVTISSQLHTSATHRTATTCLLRKELKTKGFHWLWNRETTFSFIPCVKCKLQKAHCERHQGLCTHTTKTPFRYFLPSTHIQHQTLFVSHGIRLSLPVFFWAGCFLGLQWSLFLSQTHFKYVTCPVGTFLLALHFQVESTT